MKFNQKRESDFSTRWIITKKISYINKVWEAWTRRIVKDLLCSGVDYHTFFFSFLFIFQDKLGYEEQIRMFSEKKNISLRNP